jgi:hypothetical protein
MCNWRKTRGNLRFRKDNTPQKNHKDSLKKEKGKKRRSKAFATPKLLPALGLCEEYFFIACLYREMD